MLVCSSSTCPVPHLTDLRVDKLTELMHGQRYQGPLAAVDVGTVFVKGGWH
jgi:hypothetical protein